MEESAYINGVVAGIAHLIAGTLWSTSMDSDVGALEVAAIALIWFVFVPPVVYQRWINRSAPTVMVEES